MKHVTTILAILLASCASGSEGPLYIKQMPSGLQERFRSFHRDLLALSRKHASLADLPARFPPDHTFRRPLIYFESGDVDISFQIHAPGDNGWAGMRGGPTARGGSILLADGYWLQFSVVSKHRALTEAFVSCVTRAFGKRYGLPGMSSRPPKDGKQKVEQSASHGPGTAGAVPGQ